LWYYLSVSTKQSYLLGILSLQPITDQLKMGRSAFSWSDQKKFKKKKSSRKKGPNPQDGKEQCVLPVPQHPFNSCTPTLVSKGINTNRHLRSLYLSNSQVLSLVACLIDCPVTRAQFLDTANSFRNLSNRPAFPELPPAPINPRIGDRWGSEAVTKTPAWVLDYALQESTPFHLLRSEVHHLAHASDDAFLLSGPLNTRSPQSILSHKNFHQPLPQHVPIYSPGRPTCNSQVNTVILWLPSAGVFFTPFAPTASDGIPSTSPRISYAPLPASWLGIKKSDGAIAPGGFLASIESAYRICLKNKPSSISFLSCDHVPDSEIIVPPDVYISETDGLIHTLDTSLENRRRTYVKSLSQSPTNRFDCKRTVPRHLYRHLPLEAPKMLKLEPSLLGPGEEYILRIVTKVSEDKIRQESTVRVKRVDVSKHSKLADRAAALQSLLKKHKFPDARKEAQVGEMYVFGEHVFNGRRITNYKNTKRLTKNNVLPEFMVELRKYLSAHFPYELAAMIGHMHAFGEHPSAEMGGSDGVTKSINVSVNLGNTPHYDNGDLGIGFGVWFEDIPGSARNWYFMLPNVLVTHNGKVYEGVRIKLGHGVAISWDGVAVRHCTTVTEPGTANNVYGFHATNNCRSIKKYPLVRQGNEN
jgi:hypothetical protein